jgi:predicted DNA binding CopG/RHH family protein
MTKLPEFKTDQEAYEFFEEHSVADYWEEMEPVEDVRIDIPRPPQHLVTLRFYPNLLDEVKRIAEQEHVPYQVLIQKWVADRLSEERQASLETA